MRVPQIMLSALGAAGLAEALTVIHGAGWCTGTYATSGQPPFGAGPTDAVVYRILHAQPSIAAVPEALRPLVAATR